MKMRTLLLLYAVVLTGAGCKGAAPTDVTKIVASVGSTGEAGALKFKYGSTQVYIADQGDFVEAITGDSLRIGQAGGHSVVKIAMSQLVKDSVGLGALTNVLSFPLLQEPPGVSPGIYIKWASTDGYFPLQSGTHTKLKVDSVVGATSYWTTYQNGSVLDHITDAAFVYDNGGAARFTTCSASPVCP